jgi:hypothetical protein
MRFKHVVLAGSVLPTTFPWDDLIAGGQVGRVLNERANRDWPVALLCNILRALRQRDVGPAGFAGFEGQDVEEVAYHRGDHGAALRGRNADRLVAFALDGSCSKADGLQPAGFYRQLSNLAPWAGRIAVILAAIALGAWIVNGFWLPIGTAVARAGIVAAVLAGLYVVLDIL